MEVIWSVYDPFFLNGCFYIIFILLTSYLLFVEGSTFSFCGICLQREVQEGYSTWIAKRCGMQGFQI